VGQDDGLANIRLIYQALGNAFLAIVVLSPGLRVVPILAAWVSVDELVEVVLPIDRLAAIPGQSLGSGSGPRRFGASSKPCRMPVRGRLSFPNRVPRPPTGDSRAVARYSV
jgi:hypothetical protein